MMSLVMDSTFPPRQRLLPWTTPPPPSQQAGGTHPIGMFSCLSIVIALFEVHKLHEKLCS